MTRDKVVLKLKTYFKGYQLVPREVYIKYGEDCWQFFDSDLLNVLLAIREGLDKPLIINNWKDGGRYSDRGLITNLHNRVKDYTVRNTVCLESQLLGKGFVFEVMGMKPVEIREWIKKNEQLFNCRIRLGSVDTDTLQPLPWVSLDVFSSPSNPKVYLYSI